MYKRDQTIKPDIEEEEICKASYTGGQQTDDPYIAIH
jgi:hypothetical protein